MLEAEVADLTERLETRKAVERAKGVLQEQLGLSEPEAFRWIQKTAMDLRLSMRQVADGVVAHGPGIAGRRPGLVRSGHDRSLADAPTVSVWRTPGPDP